MNALGEFGQRIRALRTEKGLTQQQLADKLFITCTTVSNWEAGTRMPDIVMVSRLGKILGVKPYELIDNAPDTEDSPTLILVEDEPCLLTGFIHLISNELPSVTAFGFQTGDEALAFAETNRIDVAFLDVELFGENGIDLAEKLADINPRTNIIFLTGHSEYTFDALRLHCSGYILKPLTPEKIRHEMAHLRFPIRGGEKV